MFGVYFIQTVRGDWGEGEYINNRNCKLLKGGRFKYAYFTKVA